MTDSRSDKPLSDALGQLPRRQALTIAFAAVLAACGGGGAAEAEPSASGTPSPPPPTPSPGQTPSPSPPPGPTSWNVGALYLTAGTAATFDLSSTLPGGVARGGVFGVSSNGSALPAGITLSRAGVLALGAATSSDVGGVIFSYSEP